MEGTIDPGDEPEGTGTNPAEMAVSLRRPLCGCADAGMPAQGARATGQMELAGD